MVPSMTHRALRFNEGAVPLVSAGLALRANPQPSLGAVGSTYAGGLLLHHKN